MEALLKLLRRLLLAAVVPTLIAAVDPPAGTGSGRPARPDLSPTALAASPDGSKLYIACATGRQVIELEVAGLKIVRHIPLPEMPLGLALARDGQRLYVTCAAPQSTVCVIATADGSITSRIPAGHTALAPVLSPDGQMLYVCNRFNNEVAFLDLASGRLLTRVPVPREPVAADITPDGNLLLVANHLHTGRADVDYVAASVTVIDTRRACPVKEIVLPNGSGLLRDLRISPNGRYACVTHQISRFHLPTTQIERGWINSNALSLIDLLELRLINSVLLDDVDRGAANPWAAAWSFDGKTIAVTHAGTHELSIIEVPGLLAKLGNSATRPPTHDNIQYSGASRTQADVPNDLGFLVGLRQRIRLPETDRGPRAIVLIGRKAYVANYFSDSVTVVDLADPRPEETPAPLVGRVKVSLPLSNSPKPMTASRRGESLFNDATICFQGWQSCASCHSSDARVDGLNWDNLNDGIGNPKNVKSLLWAHRTPPAMSMGVREGAEAAVRAGLRHTLFTVRPEEEAAAIDEYLKSLDPIPSPYLLQGRLSPAAERGKRLFFDQTVGCAQCHPPPLFTDLKSYDVGTVGKFDRPSDRFDTPTLVELWRTAPYLHDGRAVSLQDAMGHWNRLDKHGKTAHLTSAQIDDLVTYLLSL